MKIVLLLLLLLVQSVCAASIETQVVNAVKDNQAMPQFAGEIDVAGAYRIQQRAVRILLAGSRPDGFKAGLTSAHGQQKFSVSQPVAGVLLANSQLARDSNGDYVFAANSLRKPVLELELGFRFVSAIRRPVADVDVLKDLLGAVVPVVEIASLGFADMTSLLGTDIIANNVAARTYLAGVPPEKVPYDLNRLQMELYHDGQLVLAGRGSDAMGDQWQSLLWLVNQSIANGWQIEPGQLLITGALGKMLPAQPGIYRAEFGWLGELQWRVE